MNEKSTSMNENEKQRGIVQGNNVDKARPWEHAVLLDNIIYRKI